MDWKNGKGFIELKMERRQNNRIISDDEEGKREHICTASLRSVLKAVILSCLFFYFVKNNLT